MIEKLADRWNRLTPREQKRFVIGGLVVGSVPTGLVIALGAVSIIAYVAEHRGTSRVPKYPWVQEENNQFRLAILAPYRARVTLFEEPPVEEQRDVLWINIFKSLERDRPPINCEWTVGEKVHENPPSFLASCKTH